VNNEFGNNVEEASVICSYVRKVSKLFQKGLGKITKNVCRMNNVIFS
jgi:hypothetical protein